MTAHKPNGIPSWGFEHPEQPDHGGLDRWEEQSAEDYAPTSQPDPAWREYVDGLELLRWSDELVGEIESTTALTFDAAWREAEVLRSVGRSGEGRDVGADLRLILGMNDKLSEDVGAFFDGLLVECNGCLLEGCFLADEINGVVMMSEGSPETHLYTARREGHIQIIGLTIEQRREHRARYAERYR